MDMPIPDAKLDHWGDKFVDHNLKRFMSFGQFMCLPEGRRQRYIDLTKPCVQPHRDQGGAITVSQPGVSRRQLLSQVATLAGVAALGTLPQPADAGKGSIGIDPKCDWTWDDVIDATEFLYLITLSYAQCQGMGDEETTCQLMLQAINQVTGGNCPGGIRVRDLALATEVR